jgi:sortase A
MSPHRRRFKRIRVRPRLGSVRAALRFLASVMMVSGAMLITDAGMTLLWQEPVSWFFVKQQQASLEDALASPPPRIMRRQPLRGDAIGKITMPTIDVSRFVVEGTDTASLRKGPGHYPSTPLPGERGTAAVAGHRTTYGAPFRRIARLKRGDSVIMDMTYGRFVYRVQRTRIVDDQDLSVLRRVSYDRLLLSACHPLYSAAQRVVVFARLARKLPPRVRERRSGALQRGLVLGFKPQDEADHQRQRNRHHGDPVEELRHE